MRQSEIVNETSLPPVVAWVPTSGNDIPPHAVPLHQGPDGQLYIARGLLGGEIHLGTTSHASSEGARLRDRYGRSHEVFEYEVLVCASILRFQLEPLQPLAPAPEVPRTAHRRPVRSDSVCTTRSDPPKRTPGAWLEPPPRKPARPVPKRTGWPKPQNDPPPYTSPVGGWPEESKHPRPIALSRRENVQLKHFAQTKCFVLIDDSPSMQRSWSQTRMALGGFVGMLSSDGTWGGLDVRFLHHSQARRSVKTKEEFEAIFDSVPTWRDEKVMAARVAQVFEESLAFIHETSAPRPAVLLIITDGMASDTQELFDAMIRICQRLDGKRIHPCMFRIHMLQMGDDRMAVRPLNDFRDRVAQRDRERRILTVMSYHRGRGLLSAKSIFKLLLASTQIPEDEDPDLGERQPAAAIAAQYDELEKIRAMGMKLQTM